MASWMRSSVSVSMLEVASSRMMMRGSAAMARAKAMSWRWPAEKVTTYAVVNPVIALLLGAVVLDEPVTLSSLAGAVLVLAGVALVLFERKVTGVMRGLALRR